MEISGWALATVFSKLIIYLGVAAAIGGPCIALMAVSQRSFQVAIARYCNIMISLAIAATAANFFIQVGDFSDTGLAGMIDSIFIEILWQSNIGDSALLRAIGLVLVLAVCNFVIISTVLGRFIIGGVYTLSVIFVAKSFTLIGHSADMTLTIQLLLGLHLVVVGWWMGALWPLWRACYELPTDKLFKLMEQFGYYAAFSVSILLFCGVILGYNLVGSLDGLLYTSYGQGIGIKLLLVCAILLLAAYHKWQLVPALLTQQIKEILARSIVVEMMLGIVILAVTTVITTLVGPEHLTA